MLTASGKTVADLSVLRGMPLSTLRLSDAGIQNLESLRGMKIRNLSLVRCAVSDLSPLEEKTLRSLRADSIPLTTFPAWKTKSLTRLSLINCAVGLPGESARSAITGAGPPSEWNSRPLSSEINALEGVEYRLQPDRFAGTAEADAAGKNWTVRKMRWSRWNRSGEECCGAECFRKPDRRSFPADGYALEKLDLNFNRISSLDPLRRSSDSGV